MGPITAILSDGNRLHLQHGPIDLIVAADSPTPLGRKRAFDAAITRFDTVLTELVEELPTLRAELNSTGSTPYGVIAKRMHNAVYPHASDTFVTCMAAVAGAVADEVLSVMVSQAEVTRAYVNNGGDIAFHLATGQTFSTLIAGLDGSNLGEIVIPSNCGVHGIATSGQGGRSFSLGIADSVTVLAASAAAADVAATLIANAVNLSEHAQITRTPATELQPDSDLGEQQVVTNVGPLTEIEVTHALQSGVKTAERMRERGQIIAASLVLHGQQKQVGANAAWFSKKISEV